MRPIWQALLVVLLALPAAAQEVATADLGTDEAVENNGTDPTRPVRSATLDFERLELTSGFTSRQFELKFNQPVGGGRSAVQLTAPLAAVDALGDEGYALGDVALRYTNVAAVNRQRGVVLQFEVDLPTAERDELGSGRYVLKPTAIYARFLPNGAILAPSLLHNVGVGGDGDRADVNLTTFDLYYVPRLANRRLYTTLDPALNSDWEAENLYGAFAWTLGTRLGPMLGGGAQTYVKPSVTIGGDRPVDWGVEVGFQVVGF